MRLGVDFTSVPAPAADATAVTVKADIYVGVEYSISDSRNAFSYSGTLGSGSGARSLNPPTNGTQKLQSLSRSVAVTTGQATTVTVSASLSGVEYVGSGSTASVTKTATIPASPYLPPGQPGPMGVSRVSDTSHAITWGASSDAVTRYKLEIYGVNAGGWATLGYTAATSWTTGSTKGNSGYTVRVTAEGPGGSSSTRTLGRSWYTRPATPGSVTATRNGTSIRIKWADSSPYNTEFGVYASSGGAYTLLATVPNGTTEYTHANPDPTKVWTYEVAAGITSAASGVGTYLTSPSRGRSNSVQLLVPPLAPTLIEPVGSVLDPAQGDVRFSWTHRPVDTSDTTGYSLRYRLVGTTAWTTHTETNSSAEYRVVTLTELGDYEWQVQTKGAHASYGAWSAYGRFTAAESPTVAVITPADGSTVAGNRVTVTWEPDVATGETVVRWTAELQDTAGSTVARRVSDGAATSWSPDYNLTDATTYTVAVTVTDSNGLTSPTGTASFTTAFALPDTPSLTATWSDLDASVSLVPTAAPGGPGTVETITMAVERSMDRGETWELVAEQVASESGVADPYAPLFGPLHYRAVAVSALPSVAYGDAVEVVPPAPTRAWFTLEDGRAIGLPYDLAIPSTRTHAVELHRFLDRPKPVASFALNYEPELTVNVSGVTLPYHGERGEEAWAEMVLGRHVFYRDPAGRRFWGVVTSGLGWRPNWYGHHGVDLTVTEVDHA